MSQGMSWACLKSHVNNVSWKKMLLRAFLFVVAKGLPNVGAVQMGNLDVTLKNVRVKRLQCCVTVDATQTLLVTINKLL